MAQTDKTQFNNTLNEGLREREREATAFFSRMAQKGEHMEEELKKYADNLDGYIKRNPVKATVLSGVIGLLLGKFLAK